MEKSNSEGNDSNFFYSKEERLGGEAKYAVTQSAFYSETLVFFWPAHDVFTDRIDRDALAVNSSQRQVFRVVLSRIHCIHVNVALALKVISAASPVHIYTCDVQKKSTSANPPESAVYKG